ncbi:MAG: hypothetical protein QXE31_03670 [Candidatus Woesearchaeota archaeon]
MKNRILIKLKKFRLKNNKKSVFFTITSILFVFLFLATIDLNSKRYEKVSDLDATRARLKVLNSFVNDFENYYLENMLYISSKEVIIGLSHFYYDNGFNQNYIKSFLSAFPDVFYDGNLTVNNRDYNLTQLNYIDKRYLFTNLKSDLEKNFSYLNIELKKLNVSFFGNFIKQIDPWTLELNGTFNYEIADKTNFASWKGKTNKIIKISVYGIYSYDSAGNRGKITNSWLIDTNNDDEASVLNKLSKSDNFKGKGICKNGCQET